MRIVGLGFGAAALIGCGGEGLRPDGDGAVTLSDAHRLRITSAGGPGRCDLWSERDWPELPEDDRPGFCTFTVEVEGSPPAYVLGAGTVPDVPGAWQGLEVVVTYPGATNGPQSNVKLVGRAEGGWADVVLRWGPDGEAGEAVVIAVKGKRYKP